LKIKWKLDWTDSGKWTVQVRFCNLWRQLIGQAEQKFLIGLEFHWLFRLWPAADFISRNGLRCKHFDEQYMSDYQYQNLKAQITGLGTYMEHFHLYVAEILAEFFVAKQENKHITIITRIEYNCSSVPKSYFEITQQNVWFYAHLMKIWCSFCSPELLKEMCTSYDVFKKNIFYKF